MEIKGTYRLPARRETVWQVLGDPQALLAAIPGCEKAEPLPNGDLRLVVAVDIGTFRSTFTGQARLVSAVPPGSATVSGEGRGRPSGSAEGQADITLAEDGAETVVSYSGSVRVGGKLGELGEPAIAAKAKALADDFFAGIASWLNDGTGGFVDRLDHAPAGVPVLGDEPSERVVEDPAERAAEVVREVEEEIEVAAARNFLGGPMVWGVLAIMVFVALVLIFR
ncbi:MAG: CoxG family protein [Bauldia sp.]